MNSPPPNIFDLAFNPPPPDPSSIFPGLTGSWLAVPQRIGPAQARDRPRLPSPRLFRGIFADGNSGSRSVQPDARRLPLLRAITRTSRAVDSVQEAFQPRRSGRSTAVVDLTGSSPSDEEHDRRGAQPGPGRPVFGYHALPTPGLGAAADRDDGDRPDSLARARLRRAHMSAHRRWFNLPRPRNTEQEERDAPAPLGNDPDDPDDPDDPPVEHVDLTGVDSSAAVDAVLARQRTDALLAQRPVATTKNGRSRLTAYKCPVCMETPVNATTTICGHLFCHQCIIDTLQWSAKQRDGHAPGGRKKCGMCPVCRKLLSIKDGPGTGRTLVPLELRFLSQKRKAVHSAAHDPKGKAKAADDAYADGVPPPSKKLKREMRETTDDQLWESYINHDLVGTA
ncbi:hypothetical protein DV737_g4596, partial [Chaetothyriales sp. CBS 132003]